LADDQNLIVKERVLWAALTDDERNEEQRVLIDLWNHRGAKRVIQVNPKWGDWTSGRMEIPIPDSAFGLPANDFRPYIKGALSSDDPMALWFWDHGYQVVDVTEGCYTLTVVAARAVPEAERLFGLLAREHPDKIRPWGSKDGIQFRQTYDPVTGQSSIEVKGV